MYRRFLVLLGAIVALCVPLLGQAPAGYLPVYQNSFLDANGNPVSNATVCAQVMLGGHPASVQVGGSAISSFSQACAPVTNGAWFMNLPDMSTAVPRYAGVSLQITDDVSGNSLLAGYGFIQPRSVPPQNIGGAPFWCNTQSGCNLGLLPPNYPASDAFVAPVGAQGAQGATGCVVGSGPNACTTALTPKMLGGVVYAVGYGAQCVNGDDTAALQAAIAAAKAVNAGGTQGKLVLPPGKCGTSQTLDVTNLTVEGAGGKTNTTLIVPTMANPAFDMVQTSGQTRMVSVSIFGGWDGKTTGLTSNCMSNISKPSNGQFGYQLDLRDVHLGNCGNDGLLLTDAAYVNLDTVRFDLSGGNGLEQRSGATAGFQNTTLNFSGQVGFGVMGNFAILISNAVNVSYSGAITTIEGNRGMAVTGGSNRALNLSNLYFENNPNTSNGKCIDLTNSGGIGLLLASNFGPGCAGVFPDDVKSWGNVQSVSSDLGFNPPSFDDGMATVLRSYNASVNGPQTYRLKISDQGTVAGSSWTSIGIATNGAGNAWNAKLTGVWLDGTTQPKGAMDVEISSANPAVVVGGVTIACTIGDGTAQGGPNNTTTGQFQCRSYNYAAFAGSPRFLGELTLTVSQQFGANAGIALQTPDAIAVGGVNSSGPVAAPIVRAGNGFTGMVTGVGQFCSGVLISSSATACP